MPGCSYLEGIVESVAGKVAVAVAVAAVVGVAAGRIAGVGAAAAEHKFAAAVGRFVEPVQLDRAVESAAVVAAGRFVEPVLLALLGKAAVMDTPAGLAVSGKQEQSVLVQ